MHARARVTTADVNWNCWMSLPIIRPQSRKHMKRIFGHSLYCHDLPQQTNIKGIHNMTENKSVLHHYVMLWAYLLYYCMLYYFVMGRREIVRGFVCSWSVGKPLLWSPYIQRPLHKRKGGQVRFSNDQTIELEKMFETQKYLSPPERKRLAKVLQLSERQVRHKITYYYIHSSIFIYLILIYTL